MPPAAATGPPLAELLADQVLGVAAALRELSIDPERLVHDVRVALRALRSTLELASPNTVAETARPLRRELSWLAGVLGPARDAQVVSERMRTAVQKAGAGRTGGRDLLAHFDRASTRAFADARRALATDRFAALVAMLDEARLGPLVAVGAETTTLAPPDLGLVVRNLQRARRASDEELHALRKSVKRVRSVRGRRDGIDKALRSVQGVLGDHQDSVVARQRLAEVPRSDLVDVLVAREERVAARTEELLAEAVRKLRARCLGQGVAT